MSSIKKSMAETLEVSASSELILRPIGVIHSAHGTKFDAPHQPRYDKIGAENRIDLYALPHVEQTLTDIEGFERLWLIWWFHRNQNWSAMVRPPRGPSRKRGVFATRSPHRPNPIGITTVTLIRRKGRSLFVGEVDLISGTPILDIKPYLPNVDAFPDSRAGWVEEMEAELAARPRHTIEISPLAQAQLLWLKEQWQIDFFSVAREILEVNPEPHPTRRIVSVASGFRMACGAWRVFFSACAEHRTIQVSHLEAGYPERLLTDSDMNRVPDRDAQIAFKKQIWE